MIKTLGFGRRQRAQPGDFGRRAPDRQRRSRRRRLRNQRRVVVDAGREERHGRRRRCLAGDRPRLRHQGVVGVPGARRRRGSRVDEREVIQIAALLLVLMERQVGQVVLSGQREVVPAVAAAVGGLESEIAAF